MHPAVEHHLLCPVQNLCRIRDLAGDRTNWLWTAANDPAPQANTEHLVKLADRLMELLGVFPVHLTRADRADQQDPV